MTEAEQPNNPGKILRAAREESGLSVQQVADQLHLRSAVVESLEREDYREFSSDVFLKGYFRSYCRLVNLHEVRMVELLDAQLKLLEIEAKAAAQTERSAPAWNRPRNLAVLVFLVALCLVLAKLLFDGASKTDYPVQFVEPTQETVEQDVIDDSVPDEVPSEQAADTGDEQNGQRSSESVTPEPILNNAVLPVVGNTQPVSSVSESEGIEEQAVEESPGLLGSENTVQQTNNNGLNLAFSFTGDCWVQIKATDGRTLKAALLRAGNSLSLNTKESIEVVLGDGTQARLLVNGEVFDIERHMARNGRAEFSLSPAAS